VGYVSPEHDEPLVRPLGEEHAPFDGDAGGAELTAPEGHEEPAAASPAVADEPAPSAPLVSEREPEPAPVRHRPESTSMLPSRSRRTVVESLLVRIIATAGVVGIGVAIAAIMVSSKSQGWIVGLVVSIVSVVLAAILWSSRQL
jgi:hypothetical protein